MMTAAHIYITMLKLREINKLNRPRAARGWIHGWNDESRLSEECLVGSILCRQLAGQRAGRADA